MAFNLQSAIVAIENMFDDSKPKTGTTTLTRAPLINPVETLGETWNMLLLDADSRIQNAEYGRVALHEPPDFNHTTWRCVGDCIENQV